MRFFTVTQVLTLCLLITGTHPLEAAPNAESPQRDPHGTAAFLFEYETQPGMSIQFEDGYRRHLDWHRAMNDPLSWYAWYVFSGPRAGRFIDGAFGLSFSDFDHRVDPAADRADFARNVAPFTRPVSRLVYRLRPELGTAAVFDRETFDGETPSAMAEVSYVRIRAGLETQFEEALAQLRSQLLENEQVPSFSCYELLSGGERPSYMLLIPRQTWSEYEEEARFVLRPLSGFVERIETETWIFRKDLTYFADSVRVPVRVPGT